MMGNLMKERSLIFGNSWIPQGIFNQLKIPSVPREEEESLHESAIVNLWVSVLPKILLESKEGRLLTGLPLSQLRWEMTMMLQLVAYLAAVDLVVPQLTDGVLFLVWETLRNRKLYTKQWQMGLSLINGKGGCLSRRICHQ